MPLCIKTIDIIETFGASKCIRNNFIESDCNPHQLFSKLPAEVNKLKHERHPSRSTGSGGTSVSSPTIDISARLQHRRLLFSAELGPCSLYHRSRQLLLLLRSRLCGHQSSHQVSIANRVGDGLSRWSNRRMKADGEDDAGSCGGRTGGSKPTGSHLGFRRRGKRSSECLFGCRGCFDRNRDRSRGFCDGNPLVRLGAATMEEERGERRGRRMLLSLCLALDEGKIREKREESKALDPVTRHPQITELL
ncbi:hypothetical protein LXL04_017949 [Taraxacum kok-saghyz]